MDFYIVSSNCRHDGKSDFYSKIMRQYQICMMGWTPGENDSSYGIGQKFKDLPIGTGIVIARKGNWKFDYVCMGTLGDILTINDLEDRGMSNDEIDAVKDLQIRIINDYIDLDDDRDILGDYAINHRVMTALMPIIKDDYPEEVKELTKMIVDKRQNMENLYIQNLLLENKNIILHGAPGTGKTFLARQIAENIGATGDHVGFVQFHPSYDYTDFVEGLRPAYNGNFTNLVMEFKREDGIFKKFCKDALEGQNSKDKENYVFIIDEINRGEISKIFGELFYSIDPGYRGPENRIKTQYQNLILDEDDPFYDGFYIPDNVYVIGTMNDIDRSVDSMDFAFRRRFTFVEISATDTQTSILSDLDPVVRDEAIRKMNNLNDAIWNIEENTGIDGLSPCYHIGAAYFKTVKDINGFEDLWNYHLKGLLREYLRGYDDVEATLKSLKDAYDK